MVSLDRALQMLHGASVAVFAGETGFEGGEIQLVVGDGVGRVTAEARLGIFLRERAPDRLFNRFGRHGVIPHGEVQAIQRRVIADQALVHLAMVFDDPGLGLGAHCPQDRERQGVGAVAHNVLALPIPRVDFIGIGPMVEGHLRMRNQIWIVSRELHRATHLRAGLSRCLGTVTACTGNRPFAGQRRSASGLGGRGYAAQHKEE